jgi:sugar O-acyltransferase (sialic acid O-acetyltransferase NeuD family)
VGRNQMSDNVPCHVCGERAVHLPEEKPVCHKHATNASSSVILWGGTGQAKVIRPILEAVGHRVVMVFDNARIVPPFADVPMGGDWNDFVQWRDKNADEFSFVVCIGGTRGRDRVNILEGLMSYNLTPITVLHGTAWLADSSYIDQGCQILAMAAVCENARLGVACIINTNATIDHDCRIGQGVHVMPGATIAGEVVIDNYASIGSNATVLPRLRIGEGAIVGAGAVVTHDVPSGDVVIGCPARQMAHSHLRKNDVNDAEPPLAYVFDKVTRTEQTIAYHKDDVWRRRRKLVTAPRLRSSKK